MESRPFFATCVCFTSPFAIYNSALSKHFASIYFIYLGSSFDVVWPSGEIPLPSLLCCNENSFLAAFVHDTLSAGFHSEHASQCSEGVDMRDSWRKLDKQRA